MRKRRLITASYMGGSLQRDQIISFKNTLAFEKGDKFFHVKIISLEYDYLSIHFLLFIYSPQLFHFRNCFHLV